jgi:DNA polymerase III sliding clamp (beta) subunit (PCNA family)
MEITINEKIPVKKSKTLLENIVFINANMEGIYITECNPERIIKYKVDGEIKDEGSVVIKADYLSIFDYPLTIKSTTRNIVLSSENIQIKVPYLKNINEIQLPDNYGDNIYEIKREVLKKINLPELEKTILETDNDKLKITAIHSIEIYQLTVPISSQNTDKKQIIMKNLECFREIIEKSNADTFSLHLNEEKLIVTSEDSIAIINTINIPIPNYNSVIEKTLKSTEGIITVNAEQMQAVLEIASFITEQIDFKIKENSIYIEGKSEKGEFGPCIFTEAIGEGRGTYNSERLKKATQYFEENIQIMLGDSSPIVFKGGDLTYILAPIAT